MLLISYFFFSAKRILSLSVKLVVKALKLLFFLLFPKREITMLTNLITNVTSRRYAQKSKKPKNISPPGYLYHLRKDN